MTSPGFARGMLVVALVAGCSESGAHFTLSAPEGPGSATSYRVILASPADIPSIGNQRVTPGSTATQTVPYFLQRTVAGGEAQSIDRVDGLRIKIEPDLRTMPDTTFIPFVLLYDDQGAIVGVATFRPDGGAMPAPVIVVPDAIDKYTLSVEPVVQVDDQTAAAPGQVQVVSCYADDQSTYVSGIAWRPAGGGEMRLLFGVDGSLDATGRELDLDCDGHAVSAESSASDCDDTRAWFHHDAQEACDGYDTNCDGLQATVVGCVGGSGGTNNICADPTTGQGVALCDDRTGTTGTCMSDPSCLCAQGSTACVRCSLQWQAAPDPGNIIPCQPGLGSVTTLGLCGTSEPCTVEVLAVRGGWRAEIAADSSSTSFGSKATNVTSRFVLKAKRPEGPGVAIAGAHGETTGEVDFAITQANGATRLLALDLAIDSDAAVTCQGTGPYTMYCTP